MPLDAFRPIGRSGLIVSPMALGAMTFRRATWGTDDAASAAVFDAYVEAGGNFVDTAESYSDGGSEELLGRLVRERGLRERTVIATKFGWATARGNPNAGGSGRKNVRRAVEGSLRRLGTDWIDLYWLHVWDRVTPALELLVTLNDLVRAGKIRYFGLSNAPAWFVTQMVMLAQAHGLQGPVMLQNFYALVERSIENEHLPLAREFGLAVQPWAPLATGLLTGKYAKGDVASAGGRLSGENLFGDSLFTDRNWAVVEALGAVAAEAGLPPAQVALAWVLGRPGVCAPIVGATRPEQVRSNVAALDVSLSPEHRARLDAASAPPDVHPYFVNGDGLAPAVFGAEVARWDPGRHA
jgi:aryl-alcohol dehydrogenase-like predicted oxidoreductase